MSTGTRPHSTEMHGSGCQTCAEYEQSLFDEARVRDALHERDHLEWHARAVANYVWQLRWPAQPAPFFEMSFDTDDQNVSAGWWAHQDNQSESFPVSYLWSTYAQIEAAEHARAEVKRAREAQAAAARRAEGEAQERARLRSLLAKYPDER